MSVSPVKDFYRRRNLLITGVSGFIGKVLLEKILRSLPDVGTIFVLVRPKKGLTPSERLTQILTSRVFSFHPISPSQVSKVVAVSGDVTLPDFGLAESDLDVLSSVSVVLHGAASIRFDSSLAEHMKCNVLAAKYLSDLCPKLPSLEVVVFVSTAFSNCHLTEIDEVLYPLPHDPEDVIKLYEMLDEETLESLVPNLIDNRPNTYTYTKAMSEHIIAKKIGQMDKRPTLVILRPAIVGPAVKEPVEGWTDSVHGPAGLSILAGLGIMQTVDWDYNVKPDAFPVDFVVNAILSTGWHSFTFKPGQNTIYNMTSTNFRPMPAGEFMALARESSMDCPSIYAIRPVMHPPRFRQSRVGYAIRCFLYHTLFAYLIDLVLMAIGRQPIMVRIVNKMHKAIELMKYFALNEWKFYSMNYMKLMVDLSPNDVIEFNSDIRRTPPDFEVIGNVWKGCRRYILNEPDENVTIAKKKYIAICFFYRLYQMALIYLLLRLVLGYTPVTVILVFVMNQVLQIFGFDDDIRILTLESPHLLTYTNSSSNHSSFG